MAEVVHIKSFHRDWPTFYYCDARVQAGPFHPHYDKTACYYCREEWWLEKMVQEEEADIEYNVDLKEYPSMIGSVNW